MDVTALSATTASSSSSFFIYTPISGAHIYASLSHTRKNTPPIHWNFNPINIKRKWKDTEIGGPPCHSQQSPLAEISLWTSSDWSPWFPERHHFYVLEWAPQMQKNSFFVRYLLGFSWEGDQIIPQPSCQRGVRGAVSPLLGKDPFNWTGWIFTL